VKYNERVSQNISSSSKKILAGFPKKAVLKVIHLIASLSESINLLIVISHFLINAYVFDLLSFARNRALFIFSKLMVGFLAYPQKVEYLWTLLS